MVTVEEPPTKHCLNTPENVHAAVVPNIFVPKEVMPLLSENTRVKSVTAVLYLNKSDTTSVSFVAL